MTVASARLAVLGPVALLSDGAVAGPAAPRARRLLAALAVHAGEVVSTDRLADVVWGEAQPAAPAQALHTLVSRLRRLLPGEADGLALLTRAPGYLLQAGPDAMDAQVFADLAAEGRDLAVRDPQRAADLLRRALGLWRGAAYAEFADEEFARAEAARLDEMRVSAEENLAEALLATRRTAEAIARLESLRVAQPLRERPHAMLIRALHADGRTGQALTVYTEYRRALADELGIDPSPRLQRMHAAVLRGEEAQAAAPGPAQAGAEPAQAVAAPGPAQTAAPARAVVADDDGGQDRDADGLIGRAEDLALLLAALAEPGPVTLTGPGGVGKTSLARAAGRRLAGAGRPSWWVDLAAVADGAAVAEKVLTVLGAPAGPGATTAAVAEALAPSHGLVILDNAEHVLAAVAELVSELSRECRWLRVLVTSRERLAVAGERVRPLAPLAVDATGTGSAPGTECAAVRLYLRRAAEAAPDAPVRADDLPRVRELCRLLDGLPLALELAAGRTASLTPDELVSRMSWRFRVLRGGSRAAADRHRSLRAMVDWSYDLLGDVARQVFVRASVFAGEFTLADAERVLPEGPDDQVHPGDVAGVLADLVDGSMVAARRSGGVTRYRLLDTMRAYGRERLTADVATGLAGRHARHQLAAVESVSPLLYTGRNRSAVRETDERLDELRAAHAWALEHEPALAARLIVALAPYVEQRALDEVTRWAERTVAAAGDRIPDDLTAGVLGVAALGERSRGDLAAALRLAERGVALAGGVEQAAAHVAVLALSDVALFQGRTADASRLLAQIMVALGPDVTAGHRIWIAATDVLARLYGGAYADGVARAERAYAEAVRDGEPVAAAWAAYLLAEAWAERRPAEALEMAERALAGAREHDVRFLAGIAQVTTATLQSRHGPPARAAELFVQALDSWTGTGNRTQQWIALRSAVGLLLRCGAPADAAVLLGTLRSRSTASPTFGPDAVRLAGWADRLCADLSEAAYRAHLARGEAMDDATALDWIRQVLHTRWQAGSGAGPVASLGDEPASSAVQPVEAPEPEVVDR